MKNAIFTLGLIAGIIGILSCGLLLFTGFNLPVTHQDGEMILIVAAAGLLLQVAGMVFSFIVAKNPKILGALIIIVGITNIAVVTYSIAADSQISFIGAAISGVMFLVAGIMALSQNKEKIKV